MDWNDVKTFLAVAESGSLSGAAKQLGHNHSTIFRRLNRFEKAMDVRLFERLSTGYLLTASGERMHELAQNAALAMDKIELELAGQDLSPSGKVKLTTAPNLARTIVPPALVQLKKQFPDILVEVSIGDSDYNLNRREADIALRATTSPPENLIGRRLANIDWWICGSDSKGSGQPTSLKQLADQPIIGADSTLIRLQSFQWLEREFKNDIVARCNDLSTMAALARDGLGYALLPSDQQEIGLKRLFKIDELKGELWLLTHPDLRNVQRIRAVWEAIVEAADGYE